ncbi:hypothetical protein P692DRAFT_20840003, partial [Suillus brevipes Sb2]
MRSVGVRRSGEVLRAQSWSSVVWARIIPAMFNNDMVLFLLYPYVKRPSLVVQSSNISLTMTPRIDV